MSICVQSAVCEQYWIKPLHVLLLSFDFGVSLMILSMASLEMSRKLLLMNLSLVLLCSLNTDFFY